MTEAKPPRRRWFQFSLATMFVVVTVVAMWLGWELSIVSVRKAAIADMIIVDRAPVPFVAGKGVVYRPANGERLGIPFWRIWLGDLPAEAIQLPASEDANASSWHRVFPEAAIARSDGSLMYDPQAPAPQL